MSRSSFLIILLAALAAFAFDGDRDSTEFYLQSGRIYYPGEEGIAISISGRFNRRNRVLFEAFRIADPVDFFSRLSNPHSPGEGPTGTRSAEVRDGARFQRIARWEHRLKRTSDYWYNEAIALPVKEKGTYIVRATLDGHEASTVVLITELGLIVKQSETDVMAYAIDRRTGRRVANIPITFAQPGAKNVTVRTGDDGVATTSTKELRSPNEHANLIVSGAKDGSFVISDSWYYYWYGGGRQNGTMYMHTDRPVYRPTQTVYYRGIFRSLSADGGYTLPYDRTAYITITDPRGGALLRDTCIISDLGTFNDSLTLADEPPLGDYTITALIEGGTYTSTFAVEEYKKPEYEVKVLTDRQSYTRGERITATVKADYYFGSPVTSAKVEWQIIRARYWRPWWKGTEWAYLYNEDDWTSQYGTQIIKSESEDIGGDGTLVISFDTEKGADEDYIYTIRASVVDASRRSISGSASTQVTRGEYYINARPARYVYKPGEEMRTIVNVTAFDGERPVSAPFDVKIQRIWWEGKRYAYDDRREETVFSGSGRSGSDGEGSVPCTIEKGGYYTVGVVARDTRGNEIATSTSFYVADGATPWWWGGTTGDAQIIPDRDLYHPGDVMTALIVLPAGNADALVTAEGATIYKHAVIRLSDNTAILRMPIEERFAPAIFLNVGAMSQENFHLQTKKIAIAPDDRIIRLQVVGDKEIYRPGEEGAMTVRAVDRHGRPVANADVAVGIVDEAIYAIRPDRTQPIESFFYGLRTNQVTTNSSLSFYFYDYSREAVARSAPLGAAADDRSKEFSANAAPPMGERDLAAKFKSTSEETMAPAAIRSDFRDLMFWTPSIRTGADGTARVTVRFPDNLTTWRVTARGVTRATSVGQTTAKVVARKDLMVRMETPRFITQGDSLLIATTIHNYLPETASVKTIFEAKGVDVEGREQNVTIPSKGEKRIDWKVNAPRVGRGVFTVRALSAKESDAMEMSVPILPRGVRTASNTAIDLSGGDGEREVTITIPSASEATTRTMLITLAPSAASAALGSLDELIGYPYGCVEQTMSRFLPVVVVADALEKVNVPFDPQKKSELPKMAATGLKRLYQLQHDDGGWGWWEHDETNPYMTAYVVYGMTVAKRDGYPVDADRYQRGMKRLIDLIGIGAGEKGRGGELTTAAYMLYAASNAGGKNSQAVVRERTRKLADEDDLNNYALGLLTMAAHLQGETALASRYADRLVAGAITTATAASWPGRSWHYNWSDDEVETTAFAIRALLATQGDGDLVGRGVRYLLSQKKGSSWNNTRQTAMTAYALVDYLLATRELDPDYAVSVSVNGRQVAFHRMTKEDIYRNEILVSVPTDGLREGANSVKVTKKGSGKLYATARVEYFATGPELKAADAGFLVDRNVYLLRRMIKDGEVTYAAEKFDGTAKSGDELLVRVRVTPSQASEYVMVEDPLPAGCEVVGDTRGYVIPDVTGYEGNYPAYGYRGARYWNWWYADRDVRDEKVAFFAPSMSAQQYEFSYIVRAQIPGSYSVMPTVAQLMYYPEIRGNSSALRMEISD